MNRITCIAALILAFTQVGCLENLAGNRNEGPLPFPWIVDGRTVLTLDFHPVSDTLVNPFGGSFGDTPGALIITISSEDNDYFFTLGSPWGGWVRPLYPGINGLQGVRTMEGLEAEELHRCDDIWGITRYTYVRVPADARTGREYPQYSCDDEVVDVLQVEAVNKEVHVPAGDFTTFVLRSSKVGRREYWSKAEGLVKIEVFEPDGDLLGYYELARKEIIPKENTRPRRRDDTKSG